MCRVYWGKQPFVRYCYKTGQRGVKRMLSPAELETGVVTAGTCDERTARRAATGHGRRVFLNVHIGSANEETVADVARYMDARYTINRENCTAQFYAEQGISDNMIQRCESFGWETVSADFHTRTNSTTQRTDETWDTMTAREQIRILGNNIPSPSEPRPLPDHADALEWYMRQMASMYGTPDESGQS